MKVRRLLVPAVVYSFACYSLILLISSSLHSVLNTLLAPTLDIHGGILARCCLSKPGGEDICGKSDCLWTCDSDYLSSANFVESLGDEAFFHETSGVDTLSYRQACSVESLALLNPELSINVLMTSQTINLTTKPMQALENYANVKFRAIKLSDYFLKSPLEQWYFCTDWNYGPHAVSHLSDALRFLTLYKSGGYYFDLDFVMIQPVTNLRNFTAVESNDSIAAGAMHFNYRHPVILAAIDEFRTTYRKDDWSYNGPGVLTRVLLKDCKARNVSEIRTDSPTSCRKFNVLPPKTFYPIHYDNWTDYFSFRKKNELPNWKQVIGAHVWNKLSRGSRVFKNSNQLYSRLSRLFCPRVYSAAPDVF